MLKWIGIALLALACIICGNAAGLSIKTRIRRSDAVILLLYHIKEMVAVNIEPARILQGFENSELERTGLLYDLNSGGIACLGDVCAKNRLLYLNQRKKEILKEFSCGFVRCHNPQDCAELCAKYIALFEADGAEDRKKQMSQAELYVKLGYIAAAVVFVVLM